MGTWHHWIISGFKYEITIVISCIKKYILFGDQVLRVREESSGKVRFWLTAETEQELTKSASKENK